MKRAGLKWTLSKDKTKWPKWGLVRVQWEGPWTKEGVPMRVRYRHTHWVGARTTDAGWVEVFDINAMSVGGWIDLATWQCRLVPWLIEHYVPKGDGKWHLTHILEVER